MKKIILIALLGNIENANAQSDIQNNGTLQIHPGGSFSGWSNFTNTSSATLINNGTLYLKAFVINDEPGMSSGTGTTYLNGSSNQQLNGSAIFKVFNLFTDNAAGFAVNNDISIAAAHSFVNGIMTTSVTPNYVVYETGSSYSGSADSKHVNGRVKKLGATDFTFPVGDNTYVRPVALENMSASSEYVVRYITPTPNSSNMQSPIVSMMTLEAWEVLRNSGGTTQVHLNWDNGKVTFPNYVLSQIVSAYYDGSNWTSQGGTATGNVTTTGEITSAAMSSYGYFAIGSVASVLPVTFINVTAQRKDIYNDVKWLTVDEKNAGHYEVQRSDDGINFKSIGSVQANNRSSIQEYGYRDYLPFSGIAFYRIKNVDNDGKNKLSKVVSVYERSFMTNEIKVLNPAKEQIVIRSKNDADKSTKYVLYKENGQVVLSGNMNLNAGMDNSINLPGTVAKGYYILQLVGEKINYTQKILIQ